MTASAPNATSTAPRASGSPWLSAAAVCAAVLVAFFVAAWRADRPGLNYDEILFVNAALGGKSDDFVDTRLFGMPVLLMDYIGALKAWLFAPLFAIFPIDAWSVRLPAIGIGLLGALLTAAAMREWFGRAAASIALALIIFDPTMLTHSRLDWGPNALMFFLRGSLLFALAKWSRAPSARHAWFVFSCIAVGLFEKLSFLWLAVAGLGLVATFHARTFTSLLRKDRGQALAWTATVAITALAMLRAISLSGDSADSIDRASRLLQAGRLLSLTWAGGGALNFAIGDGARFLPWFSMAVLPCVVVALFGIPVLLRESRETLRPWTMIVLFTGFTALMFVVTKTATGPHHSAVLSGLWQLLLVPPLVALIGTTRGRRPALAAIAIASAGMLAITCATVRCMIRENPRPNWDPANWRIGEHVAAHPHDRFILADWGMGNQVIAATRHKGDFADRWPSLTEADSAADLVKAEAAKGVCHYVIRAPAFATFKQNAPNLMTALTDSGIQTEVVLSLANQANEPMILIIKATPPKPSSEFTK